MDAEREEFDAALKALEEWINKLYLTLLRDWFAGKAIAATIDPAGAMMDEDAVSREAYDLADAMLVERRKRGELNG